VSDSYQAIYDAVRSRISNGDIGAVAREVMWQQFDISWMRESIAQDIRTAIYEYQRPSAVYRRRLFPDGNQWCALYGENLQEGVTGFGDTPDKACIAFDLAWLNETTTHAQREDQ